ncbi:MAG: AbrB/MazE/SpoVT family DNA-binding domain-containing protein [Actinobacteria bacterium]|nr:AbrB/MazE/SpoVT family DNA-binding domain-containing protein [Actinomycetota bacterium]
MKTAIVSKKGWVVIPSEIREKYKINKGDMVSIIDYGDLIAIIPYPKDVIKESAGMFEGKSLTKALIESRKEEIAKER